MKVLLRQYDNKEYAWFDATYEESENAFRVNTHLMPETNIVSVHEDNRNEFVTCNVCGKTFKNGSPEIKAHTTPITDTSKCLQCMNRYAYDSTETKKTYQLINGDIYKETATRDVVFKCRVTYPPVGISTDQARHQCIYNRCINAKMIEFSDFFTQNPEVFDAIITSDVFEENPGSYKEKATYYGRLAYQLPIRNNVWACANKTGIIDHFEATYRRETYNVYYSKKYNQLFTSRNGHYEVWNPYNMPDSSRTLILNKIAELYG